MKKYFYLMMAMATLAVTSCKEPEPEPLPIIDDDENAYDVLYEADVDYYYGLGYSGLTINYADLVKDGKHIWEEFGLDSEAEFIAALGTDDVASGGAQTGQSINFGAIDGSTGYLNETASTTNGWGHWFTAQGDVCSWGDDAYVFTEGYFVSAQNLEVNIGNFPDRIAAGDKYTVTEAFFDDETTVAVQFNINVTDELPAVTLNKVGEGKTSMRIGYDADYTTYEIEGIDYAAIASAIGCDVTAATFYGVDANGNVNSLFKGTDIWFNGQGEPSAWGAGCTIHFGFDPDNGIMNTCLYPDETIVGNTYSMTVAVANGTTAYYQTVEISISEQNTWTGYAEISVEGEETPVDFDFAAIAAYLGVNDLTDALMDGTAQLKPVNADGSYYGEFSQADEANIKGVFYNLQGDCCNWLNISATDGEYYGQFYSTFYFGKDGDQNYLEVDITPYAASEENLGDYTFRWDIVSGDKVAHLVIKATLISAVPWAVAEVGSDYVVNVKMTAAGGYKAYTIALPSTLAEVVGAEAVVYGLSADDSEYLAEDGTVAYTANNGWWYNAEGNVCSWGDNSLFFLEPAGDYAWNLGQFDTAPEVGTKATLKIKYVGTATQVVTFNVEIVEAI